MRGVVSVDTPPPCKRDCNLALTLLVALVLPENFLYVSCSMGLLVPMPECSFCKFGSVLDDACKTGVNKDDEE